MLHFNCIFGLATLYTNINKLFYFIDIMNIVHARLWYQDSHGAEKENMEGSELCPSLPITGQRQNLLHWKQRDTSTMDMEEIPGQGTPCHLWVSSKLHLLEYDLCLCNSLSEFIWTLPALVFLYQGLYTREAGRSNQTRDHCDWMSQ